MIKFEYIYVRLMIKLESFLLRLENSEGGLRARICSAYDLY
jgi:hypothetical protein